VLKEELSSTSDTLDKNPTTLNVYVDQVNTLKYLREKQAEFDKKMDTITRL
jgi:phenylpyruvate tautomerase PptA (4-oxalocrotonate tautomerase family)